MSTTMLSTRHPPSPNREEETPPRLRDESRRPTDAELSRIQAILAEADPMIVSDAARAMNLVSEALTLARAGNDRRGEAYARCLQGAGLFFLSQYSESSEAFTDAREVSRQIGDSGLEARALNGLGLVAKHRGEFGVAMEHFLASLSLVREHQDENGRIRVLNNIASIRRELGDYQAALEVHLEVSAAARALGYDLHESSATINVVMDYQFLGRHAEALALAEKHLPFVRERGIRQHEVLLQTQRAMNLLALDDVDSALALALDVQSLATSVRDYEALTQLHTVTGRAYHRRANHALASEYLERAVVQAREYGLKAQECQAHQYLAEVYESLGDWPAAFRHLRAHHDLERTLHAQEIHRKLQVFATEAQVELFKREAEVERLRRLELAQANHALQDAHERLTYRATHDALTGLANRARFQAEVERALQVNSEPLAVLFIDLDRFKDVNDSLGHDVGDELLKQVAERLQRHVRGGDLVARMGGDEFTLLLANLRDPIDAERVAHKLLGAFSAPFDLAGGQLHVTASIGVAVAPRDGSDVRTLQKHADVAMYRAKHDGKNTVRSFRPVMAHQEAERLDLERDLRTAIREAQFVLHYQGQFDVQTGRLVGFEALVRWQHPRAGLIAPGRFIPAAEASGMIVPIGDWVLREACRQASAWGARELNFSVSVNVSAAQFDQPDFVGRVEAALTEFNLEGRHLILELTESLVVRNVERATEQLRQLRQLGVRIAMDDFGTGQSSLSLLRQLPIDFLKIDRSFVSDTVGAQGTRADSRLLVGVMVTLAHGLNLQVTAEGVETPEQQQLLEELGCDSVQGFHLARPLPASEAASLLRARTISRSA